MSSDVRDPALEPTIGVTPRESATASTDPVNAPTTPAPRDLAVTLVIGERLGGRYQVQSFLGEGGMGAVYRALDEKLGEEVALKVVRGSGIDDTLRDEVRLAQKVTHVNVCRTYDLEEIGGHYFVKMEYVGGETLAARLARDGKLGIDEAVRIARAIADGLAAAHAKGIVHRDLKPGNIMLSEDRAVLMDFGIARLIESPGDGVAGTIGYMAPEQITEAVVDARTDLYALGCVLHEMLAGEPVFGKAKRLELAVRHVSTPPPDIRSLRSEAPRWLARALRDLLAKLPYRREIGLARLRSGPRSPARFAIPIGVALVAIAAVALWRVTVEPTWRPHVIAYQAYEEEGGTTSLSPDGRWLAFDSDRAQRGAMRIYIMDRVTLQTVQLATPHGRNVVAPRWTRDGGAILFQGEMPDGDHVFRQAVADSPPQAVGSPTDLGPGLSPDACGRDAIVYVDSGPSAKRLMLAKDDDRRALVTIGSNETLWMPRCNALGTQIVFARGMAGPWSSSNDLFVVDRIGATRRLTTDHASSNAMFSPDGRSIVYAARRDGRHDLYVMPATGGSARAMKLDGATLVADISHDGRLVAFHREESSWFPAISEGGMPRLITSQRGIYVWVRPVGTDRVLARRETASQSEIVVIETSDGSISTIASGYAPFPSIDGKRVYFRPATTPNQLAMVPIGGGPATIVASVPGTIMFGVDGPDGAHLGVETRPGAIEAFRVVSGRAEPEGVPGIVTVAPDGGWRAVTILFERSGADSRSRLQLIPPGTPLSAPSHELETGSVINPWLDDRRISYCVAAGCRILDVVAGTTTEVPAWANFYQRLAIVMPDGKRVVDSLTVSRLTRHLVTNFDAWPW